MNDYNDKSFSKKLVVITGGSRGLGLAIGKTFAFENARLVLLARDLHELQNAKNILGKEFPGIEVFIFDVDITDASKTEIVFQKIIDEIGDISVWVNNAGAILVSPYDSLVEEDFRVQMELHLFSVIRLTRWVIDHFRKIQTKGRIINICSLGGKIAVPHMLTYDTSKFALAGYSQGLASELASEDITITTIYPTVMRTGSPIQAVFKGDHEKEFNWFASSDNLPILSLSAMKAAHRIVEAARSRKVELVPSFAAKLRLIMGVIFPQAMAWTMKKVFEQLPIGQSKEYKTGAQSDAIFRKTFLYRNFRERMEMTEHELNQSPKNDAKFNLGITKK